MLDFNRYAATGNEFLNSLTRRLGVPENKARASRILRSTFRVLRENVSITESFQLIAQLPMPLKALYVDGWSPAFGEKHERLRTVEAFAIRVLEADEPIAWKDFSSLEEVMSGVKAVVQTMAEYVSPGELLQAFNTLPSEVRNTLVYWLSLETEFTR